MSWNNIQRDTLKLLVLYPPIGISVRATITLYPIGRLVKAIITLYPIERTTTCSIVQWYYRSYLHLTVVSLLMMSCMLWTLERPRREPLMQHVTLHALIQYGSVKHLPSSVKAEQEGKQPWILGVCSIKSVLLLMNLY